MEQRADTDRQDQDTDQEGVRIPADVFRRCPSCDSTDLFSFDGQAFCASCDWNSLYVYLEAVDISEGRRSAMTL